MQRQATSTTPTATSKVSLNSNQTRMTSIDMDKGLSTTSLALRQPGSASVPSPLMEAVLSLQTPDQTVTIPRGM